MENQNKQADMPEEEDLAPDSDTQSSAASAQGNRNNAELSKENTGGDASEDKAEGN